MPHTHRRRRRDETILSRRWCEHNSQLANRLHSCLTMWIFNSDDIMTSLLKKLSISIKIGVIKRYGVRSVSKLSSESFGSRRELVSNCVHTADADATKQFRRVGVGSVYWALITIKRKWAKSCSSMGHYDAFHHSWRMRIIHQSYGCRPVGVVHKCSSSTERHCLIGRMT